MADSSTSGSQQSGQPSSSHRNTRGRGRRQRGSSEGQNSSNFSETRPGNHEHQSLNNESGSQNRGGQRKPRGRGRNSQYSQRGRNTGNHQQFDTLPPLPESMQFFSVYGRNIPASHQLPSQGPNFSFNPYAQTFVPHVMPPNIGPRPQPTNERRGGSNNQQGFRPRGRGRGNRGGQRGRGARRNSDQSAMSGTRDTEEIDEEEDEKQPLRERLIRRLENNRYECAICYRNITTKDGVWSCKVCYHIFHISHGCITDWAKSSRDKEDDNKWRCPTCQTKYEKIPYNYFCFCGKQRNPTPHMSETPHSCGGICGGNRKNGCPHPCNEFCHPGPCTDCFLQIVQECNCGRVKKAARCGSGTTVSCDTVCEKLLNCGKHKCTRVCHKGNCQPCSEVFEQNCYCGAQKREVVCGEETNDNYSCEKKCTGLFSCKKHSCNKLCHSKDGDNCGICPFSTARITHCPCGNKTLSELGASRVDCEDPIPTCNSVCDKLLECGASGKRHRCVEKCHEGPCPPCNFNTSIVCRCGGTKRSLPCEEYIDVIKSANGVYLCEKRCKKKKSCGIHKCQDVCCIQEDHFCFQVCNKRLPCGNHNCENICHAGQCPRCLQASFDEQFCHCGRTVRAPPIPCGAGLPECKERCARPHACNHPVMHNCHGEVNCPPCTFLTEKECYGKHEVRRNIPCHIAAVSCGRTCSLSLSCGVHTCTRSCHFGPCEKEDEACKKSCSVLRSSCEHICGLPCHGKTECAPSKCRQKVEVTCNCGRKKTEMPCHEVDVLLAKSKVKDEENEESTETPEPGALKKTNSMLQLNCLDCDEKCMKLQRNKRFAEALSIEVNEDGETLLAPTITYPDYLKTIVKTNIELVLTFEKTVALMIDEINDPTNGNDLIRVHYPPMNIDKRRFIHEYATYFHIETLSVDQPPKRSVIITARKGVCRAPLILLSDLPKYKGALTTPGPVTLRHGDHEKKDAEPVEDDGMKPLKIERPFHQRVPKPIVVQEPAPIKQSNAFALLCSDNEDEPEDGQKQEYKDWWNDGNDKGEDVKKEENSIVEEVEEQPKAEGSSHVETEEAGSSWADEPLDLVLDDVRKEFDKL